MKKYDRITEVDGKVYVPRATTDCEGCPYNCGDGCTAGFHVICYYQPTKDE